MSWQRQSQQAGVCQKAACTEYLAGKMWLFLPVLHRFMQRAWPSRVSAPFNENGRGSLPVRLDPAASPRGNLIEKNTEACPDSDPSVISATGGRALWHVGHVFSIPRMC